MGFDLLQPILDVVERLLFSAVVHEDDPHCALVISLRDRSKAFLPGGIPHLKLHPLVLD